MKVREVTPFRVSPGTGKSLLFVKVETEDGITGWGEAYTQYDRDESIATLINAMSPYLVGRDPFAIKHFTTVMYLDWAGKRGSMEFYCALSAIEQALWDVVGKAVRQPVYNLLGGPCRSRVRVYANGWGDGKDDLEELANSARRVVELGFTAMKFDPFPTPWREIIDRKTEQRAVNAVRTVREAVGPEVDVLIEVHRRLAPQYALRFARAIEEFDPFWFEEPVSARQLPALAEVKNKSGLPVVTGEELYTKAEFRPIFETGAADIINPDVCNCGGILELKEIAAMAEPYAVAVAPHNFNSTTMGLAATVQVSACIPNFLITEYFVNLELLGHELAHAPLRPQKGYIDIPSTPGLGVEMDETALTRHEFKQSSVRPIRQYGDEA